MATKSPQTKEIKTEDTKRADRPVDRPMTGIHTQDDGRRTEHGKHPLDPEYNGTVMQSNSGVEDAKAARVEAGLEDTPVNVPADGKDEAPAA